VTCAGVDEISVDASDKAADAVRPAAHGGRNGPLFGRPATRRCTVVTRPGEYGAAANVINVEAPDASRLRDVLRDAELMRETFEVFADDDDDGA
jgi:hypothetical protein